MDQQDELVLELTKPVTIGSGDKAVTYDRLELREPTAGEMNKASIGIRSGVDSNITLISLVAKVPRPVVEGLCARDFSVAVAFLSGFTGGGPATGENSSPS